jgi:DNA-binding response OmpR family regulator
MKTPAKQILAVEDDRFLRRAWAASLRQRGWMVLTAEDGEEAFAMTQTETFDLSQLDASFAYHLIAKSAKFASNHR